MRGFICNHDRALRITNCTAQLLNQLQIVHINSTISSTFVLIFLKIPCVCMKMFIVSSDLHKVNVQTAIEHCFIFVFLAINYHLNDEIAWKFANVIIFFLTFRAGAYVLAQFAIKRKLIISWKSNNERAACTHTHTYICVYRQSLACMHVDKWLDWKLWIKGVKSIKCSRCDPKIDVGRQKLNGFQRCRTIHLWTAVLLITLQFWHFCVRMNTYKFYIVEISILIRHF